LIIGRRFFGFARRAASRGRRRELACCCRFCPNHRPQSNSIQSGYAPVFKEISNFIFTHFLEEAITLILTSTHSIQKDGMEVYQHPILQGWLEKEKRSSSLLSSLRTKRWFTIEKAGTDFSDITLSYYKSPRANPVDRCGWIFLSDCTSLDEYAESSKVTALSNTDSRRKSITSKEEGPRVIIIHHPSRKFQLRAQDRYEHHLWFDALKKHCINAISKEEQEEKEEVSFLVSLRPQRLFISPHTSHLTPYYQ